MYPITNPGLDILQYPVILSILSHEKVIEFIVLLFNETFDMVWGFILNDIVSKMRGS